MRNTLVFLFMALVYALASDMDFADTELLNGHIAEISADASCPSPRISCDTPTARFLALSHRQTGGEGL